MLTIDGFRDGNYAPAMTTDMFARMHLQISKPSLAHATL